MSPTGKQTYHWDDYSSLQAGVLLTDGQLRSLQRTLTDILKDVIQVCEKREIPYFLVGGTALGAMRHGGFIPWDDDVDIAMQRQDYERFLTCFQEEFEGKYYIQTPEYTNGYPSLIPRIRAYGSVVQSREDLWADKKNCGACLDLFIIENTFDQPVLRFLHGIMSLCMGGLLACRKTFAMRKCLKPFIIPGSKYEKKVRLRSAIGFCFAWLPINVVRKLANNCNRICKKTNGTFVTIPAGHFRFFGDMYERSLFTETKMIGFENLSCRIPATVEKYLAHCYGDWQIVPEKKNQDVHFFCAFTLDMAQEDMKKQCNEVDL